MSKEFVIKSIRLEKELCDTIQQLADSEDRNFNNMIRVMAKKYLEEWQKNQAQ